MRLKELLTDDDAVSPVIGVILMVAITVILAAVIATFVLGLGEQVSDTAPNANFQFDYNDSSKGNENVTITHTSGPAIDSSTLSVGGAGINETIQFTDLGAGEEISAGDSVTVVGPSGGSGPVSGSNIDGAFTSGERISVIFQNDNGDSATLANYEIP